MRPGVDWRGKKRILRDQQARPFSMRLKEVAYPKYLASTESSTAIEPVIIPQLVDLDPFATVGRL